MNETSTLHNNQKLMGICRVLEKHFGTLTTHAKIAVIGICTDVPILLLGVYFSFFDLLTEYKKKSRGRGEEREEKGRGEEGVEIN